MKTHPPGTGASAVFISITSNGDSSKLMSVLALATGALAMPQTSNADIIFTDLSANPPTIAGTNTSSFLIENLPGTARLGFLGATHTNVPQMLTTHSIRAVRRGGYVRIKTDAAGFVA